MRHREEDKAASEEELFIRVISFKPQSVVRSQTGVEQLVHCCWHVAHADQEKVAKDTSTLDLPVVSDRWCSFLSDDLADWVQMLDLSHPIPIVS